MARVTPCTAVCELDGDLCIGCGRTRAEIAAWAYLSDESAQAIIDRIENTKPDSHAEEIIES